MMNKPISRVASRAGFSWGIGLMSALVLLISSSDAWASSETPTSHVDTQNPLNNTDVVSPEVQTEIPQSSVFWRYSHTPFKVRLSAFLGDNAGGPIRFNTRFPEVKGDPHPASYFHSMPMFGAEFEYARDWGGLLFGAIVRRDTWHPGIKGRSALMGTSTWKVDDFSVNSTAFLLGWVFGERYREAPWTADVSLIYDRGAADTTLSQATGEAAVGQVSIDALTLRSRIHFNILATSANAVGFSAGPELSFPVWHSLSDQSDAIFGTWLRETLQLKTSTAFGVSLMSSYRF